MPFRDWYLPTSPYDLGFDRFGGFHEDRAQMRETNPRGGGDEVCAVCLRAVEARDACPACGDETDEVAA